MSEIPEAAMEALLDKLWPSAVERKAADEFEYPRDWIKPALEAAYPAIREQVLADAKARIEGLGRNVEGDAQSRLRALAYNQGRDDALAALTQPQTEIEGKPDGTWYDIPDGGGAATAAGAFDPDPLANPDCQECGNDDAGCLACGADANWDS